MPSIKLESLQIHSFVDFFKILFHHFEGFKHVTEIVLWFEKEIPLIFTDPSASILISLWKLLEFCYLTQKNIALLDFANFKNEIEKTLTIIFNKLKNLSEKEIKEIDRELIIRMFHHLELNGIIDYKDLENLELEIYRKYIFSQYFEKKLKALNDLKDFIERVKSSSAANFQKANRSSSYNEFNFTRYYTIDLVINWLLDNKVLENALKNSTQIDIIKRCQDIIKFIASESQTFPANLLIFLCGIMDEAQYEDIKKGYQDILEDLASLLDEEGLEFIFSKIEENLLEKIKNEGYFSFLKRFFLKSTIKIKKILLERKSSKTVELNSVNSNHNESNEMEEKKVFDEKKQVEDNEEAMNDYEENTMNFFGIDLMWKFIQDDSPFSFNKINESLEFFIELLKKASMKILFKKYFELCLDNIFANKSIYQSLSLMREILKAIQTEWSYIDFNLFLKNIQEKYGSNLIDIILKEMKFTHEKINDESFNLRYPYMDLYKTHLLFFQFLKNYIIIKPKPKEKLDKLLYNSATKSNLIGIPESIFQITNEHIHILWELFVTKAHNPIETIEFLKSFLSENVRISPNVILCFDSIFELFCQYLEEKIKKNLLNTISDEIFSSFFLFYQHCNLNHKNLDFMPENVYVVCEEEKIIGFRTIWNLFLYSDQEKITQDCIQQLVIVYSSLGIEIFHKRSEIFTKFLDKCLEYLKEALNTRNITLIQKILKLIESFIVSIERKKNVYYKNRNNSLLTIKSNSEKYESFQFNGNLLMKYLRLKISEVNEIPLDAFMVLFNQRNEIGKDYDEHKASTFSSETPIIYYVIQETKLENPKNMIAEKKEFMKTFFEIFDKNYSG